MPQTPPDRHTPLENIRPSSAEEWKRLRDLLARRRDTLVSKAVSTDGRLESNELRDLAVLTYVLESKVGKSPRFKPRKTSLALLFVLIGVGMTFLLTKLPVTTVETDLRVSGLSFSLHTERKLADAITATSLSVSGIESVFIPSDDVGPRQHISTKTVRLWQPVSEAGSGLGHSRPSIALDLPLVAPSTTVRIEWHEDSGEYELFLCVDRKAIAVAVMGGVNLSIPGHSVRELRGPGAHRLLLVPGAKDDGDLGACSGTTAISIRFTLEPSGAVQLSPDLDLDSLSFLRRSVLGSGTDLRKQLLPSILSGNLYLSELGGRSRPLRRNQRLLLDEFKGVAHSLRLEDSSISVLAEGRVKGLASGPTDNPRSLMPSILEWWMARESVFLVWTATLSLFGLVVGFLEFLSRER